MDDTAGFDEEPLGGHPSRPAPGSDAGRSPADRMHRSRPARRHRGRQGFDRPVPDADAPAAAASLGPADPTSVTMAGDTPRRSRGR